MDKFDVTVRYLTKQDRYAMKVVPVFADDREDAAEIAAAVVEKQTGCPPGAIRVMDVYSVNDEPADPQH